ncbi:hypothetical protein DW262_09700 [Segatella copri]|uniref:Uncharacterized protein n=1 Tax=Segatella copri TaxID=165179 RepID=A0A3R6H3U4_9BACT|nr:hypothetical protein DW263_09855 [Segatella copri]RHG34896.1 hypothetical protein DW262_09700 [Segatella copri]RHG64876.1 hypothetical protein DW250_09900 [Segatella copri]
MGSFFKKRRRVWLILQEKQFGYVKLGLTLQFFLGAWLFYKKNRKFAARNKNLKNKQHKK